MSEKNRNRQQRKPRRQRKRRSNQSKATNPAKKPNAEETKRSKSLALFTRFIIWFLSVVVVGIVISVFVDWHGKKVVALEKRVKDAEASEDVAYQRRRAFRIVGDRDLDLYAESKLTKKTGSMIPIIGTGYVFRVSGLLDWFEDETKVTMVQMVTQLKNSEGEPVTVGVQIPLHIEVGCYAGYRLPGTDYLIYIMERDFGVSAKTAVIAVKNEFDSLEGVEMLSKDPVIPETCIDP